MGGKMSKEYHAEYQKARYHRNPQEYKDRSWSRSLMQKFGITVDEYNNLYDSQNGRCAICGREEQITKQGAVWRLAVDHDHTTGKVRGLLCNACNTGMGKFGDDPDMLDAAAAYLRR